MSEDQNREQERREARRKRRVRNQIISYTVVGVLLVGLIAGGVYTGKILWDKQKKKQQQEEIIAQIQEEMDASEEEVILTEPETEPVELEPTPEEKMDEIVNAAIEVMPLEDKVAGLFIVTPESITGVNTAVKAGDGTKKALETYAVGGIVYFSKNIQNEEQLTEMINNTTMWSKYPLFIGVDEEGGSVSRVGGSGIEVEKVASAADLGATGDANQAYGAGSTIAGYLSRLGFNLDFAPVADVAIGENKVLKDRSYGSDSSVVGNFAVNMVNGLQDQGVSACMKHFPGLGGTTQDTHDGMVTTERTKEDFQAVDFPVYQQGIAAGVDFIMVSHLCVPSISGENIPSSLSPAVVTDVLRTELGYDGIVISDAMNMTAITDYYTADQAAVLALRAGCDMILMPEDFELAYQGILNAVQEGTIAEERIDDALRRIYRVKLRDTIEAQIGETQDSDIQNIETQDRAVQDNESQSNETPNP